MQGSVIHVSWLILNALSKGKPKRLDRTACTTASGENPKSPGKHSVLSGEVKRLSIFLTLDAKRFNLPHKSTLFHAFKPSLDITLLSIRSAETQAPDPGQKV